MNRRNPSEETQTMTAHGYPASVDDINLSDWEF